MAKKTSRRNRWQNPTFLFSVGLAFLLIIVYVVSLVVVPGTNTGTTTVDTEDLNQILNTPVPTAFTVPTVEPDGPNLNMTLSPSVQANGLFQVTVPSGWFTSRSEFDPDLQRARTSFSEPQRLSVIDVFLQFGVNYPSLEAMSEEFFTNEFFFDAWSSYEGFTELSRRIDQRVAVDFQLFSKGIDYLGRQVAWLDGNWLHMIRFIVPSNNPLLLDKLEELVTPTFISYRDQANGSPAWTHYADFQQGFLFRHAGWSQVSGEIGSPVVFEESSTQTRLFIQTVNDVTFDDLEAAQGYVTETLRPNASLLSSQVTSRQFGAGFLVSYSDQDNEGNPIAGLAILLLDSNRGDLKIADLRLPAAGVDLLSLEADSPNARLRQVIDSLMILPPDGYQITAGAAPLSLNAVVEATPEAEATAE